MKKQHPKKLSGQLGENHAKGGIYLDIGCGTGNKEVNSHIYYGVDIRLDIFRNPELFHGDQYIYGSAEYLPFEDNSVDYINFSVSLPYMNIPKVLKEASRVLMPGGDMRCIVHPFKQEFKYLLHYIAKLKFSSIVWTLYGIFNGILFHLFGKLMCFPNGKYLSFQSQRGMRNSLLKAGLNIVEIDDFPKIKVRKITNE